jgi:maltooligosyltrehalose trehalohydrolase
MTTSFAHELPFGATVLNRHEVRFRLWAPVQSDVAVVVEGTQVPMHHTGGGWFEAVAACTAGARYQYRLASGQLVPDPAARAQSDSIHGPSVVVDPNAYAWRETDWNGRPWYEAVIYELHAGLLGGYAGAARELPRLAQLGVTAVELMPIAQFPGARNWGYDGVLPFAPASAYGSPAELKSLVDSAHECGLMIFLDVVYNHFGPDGNYLGLYAPQMFRRDIATPWGGAIDFSLPEVRQFFTENALYWLNEYRFDGLRLDAVHAIYDPTWLDEMAMQVRARVEAGRHVHLVLENDRNTISHLQHGFNAQWNDDGHHVLHVILTGESEGYYQDYAEDMTSKLATCLAEGFVYQGQLSHHRNEKRGEPSGVLPSTSFVLFLQNHDQIGNRAFGERLTVLARPDALTAAIALQILCPQIPLLFMGEEQSSRSPFLFFTDHNQELAVAVRAGRRREFEKFYSFSDPAIRERIPDPNAAETFLASVPRPDPDQSQETWNLYQRLLEIRRREIIPRLNGVITNGVRIIGERAVQATWKLGDGAMLTLASNLSARDVACSTANARIIYATSATCASHAMTGTLDAFTTIALIDEQA